MMVTCGACQHPWDALVGLQIDLEPKTPHLPALRRAYGVENGSQLIHPFWTA